MELSVALEAAAKALVYASLMLCVGAALGRGLLRVHAAVRLTPAQGSGLADAFRRLAVNASRSLVVALAFRAWAHTAAAFGVADSFAYQNLRIITVESQWGTGWQRQMAVALVMAAVTAAISVRPAGGWVAVGGGAVALCYLLPLLGHAAGEPIRVLLHGSHILAAGIWMGTLAAISIASRGPDPEQAPAPLPRPARRRAMLSQFSPVAFTGSTLLLLTGATAAWWYLGELSNLLTTSYGRLLLLKLSLVAAAAACGFVNWQALRRPVSAMDSRRGRRLLVGVEIALALTVVIVTAVLTETEHP